MSEVKPATPKTRRPSPFLEFLRTPKGILTLFAATFALSAVLAVVVVFNRPFFEKHVREKYAPTLETTARIMRESRGKTSLPDGLLASQHELIYEAWIAAPDTFDMDLPRKMWAAAPEIYSNRVRRTMVAGDSAQRQKAQIFLEKK